MVSLWMGAFEKLGFGLLTATLLITPILGLGAEEPRGYDQVTLTTNAETQVSRDILIGNLYARS